MANINRLSNGECTATPVLERFWNKVQVMPNGCWEWTAALTNGYGRFKIGSLKDGTCRTVAAHRFAYELLVGPVPEGMELDHLYRNTACVNPAHLEPVTHRENGQRAAKYWDRPTHCPQGHPYTPGNTYVYPDGKRDCLTCKRARNRAYMKIYNKKGRK